jgi:hypothetical protein
VKTENKGHLPVGFQPISMRGGRSLKVTQKIIGFESLLFGIGVARDLKEEFGCEGICGDPVENVV